MTYTPLKKILPLVLLCSIATTSSATQVLATQVLATQVLAPQAPAVQVQKISSTDIKKAQEIISKIKNALKNFLYSADIACLKASIVYLETTTPCGELSSLVLVSMRNCWDHLIPILKQVDGIAYARQHVGPALEQVSDHIENLINQIENMNPPELKLFLNILTKAPIEIKKVASAIGMLGKFKMMRALKGAQW